MKIEDFEKELQLIDKNLSIRPNNPPARVQEMFPDVMKMASIIYRGTEVCTIPNGDIYDEPSGTYGVDLRQDGRFVAHRTRPAALKIVKDTLERLKNDKEYYQDFFGVGASSDTELIRKDDTKGEFTVVDEVPIEAQEITGGTLPKGDNE